MLIYQQSHLWLLPGSKDGAEQAPRRPYGPQSLHIYYLPLYRGLVDLCGLSPNFQLEEQGLQVVQPFQDTKLIAEHHTTSGKSVRWEPRAQELTQLLFCPQR